MQNIKWIPIENFPIYEINEYGEIFNINNRSLLNPRTNQNRVVMVNLFKDGVQHTRSVAKLVAQHYLPPVAEEKIHIYDTVMHLDGDYSNTHYSNLHWAPRWFAIKFHKQQHRPLWVLNKPFYEVSNPNEIYKDLREVTTKYGLLQFDICKSLAEECLVYPHGLSFRWCN